jgi:hypothetical protein
MKIKHQISAMLVAASLMGAHSIAQTPTELNLSLLSKLGTQGSTVGTAGPFSISFGSYNGTSLGTLFNTSVSYGSDLAGFATWYGNNSRTIYTWTGVNGSLIDNNNADYYRNFSSDTEVESYAGAPLNSVYNSLYNNNVFAFVTTGSGASLQLALIDLGITWADPTVATAGGVLSDTVVFSAGNAVSYGGGFNKSGQGLITTTISVPEPSAMSLMLLGGTALVALRRLRKNV